MKQRLLFLVTLVTVSCSKSDSELSPNGLVGTWQLINYCKPTGNSTCTPVTVPADKGVFISFDNAGQFNESYQNTKPVEYSFLGCGGGSFTNEDGNLRIRAGCMSSLNGQIIKIVSVETSRLVLIPFGTGEYVFIRS